MLTYITKGSKKAEIFKDKENCHINLMQNQNKVFTTTFISYNSCLRYINLFFKSEV